jgi:putative phage-type endonuclease
MATILELPNRDAWLEERKTGLGASDVPVVLGLSKSKTPFALWAEKCGLLPDEDLAASIEAVEWGIRLQDPIIHGFAERTGRKVELGNPFAIVRDEEYPFLFASLDATQYCPERGYGAVEAKNVGAYLSDEWKDGDSPLKFQVQLQSQLRCTGYGWGSLVGLIGGNKLIYRDMDRDVHFLDAAIPHLEYFWDCVQERRPPEIDASPITTRVLQRLHPDDNGMTTELPPDSLVWHTDLMDAKDRIKAYEEIKSLNENRIKAALGDCSFGQLPNGESYSYKTQTRAEHVVKSSTFRVLRKMASK